MKHVHDDNITLREVGFPPLCLLYPHHPTRFYFYWPIHHFLHPSIHPYIHSDTHPIYIYPTMFLYRSLAPRHIQSYYFMLTYSCYVDMMILIIYNLLPPPTTFLSLSLSPHIPIYILLLLLLRWLLLLVIGDMRQMNVGRKCVYAYMRVFVFKLFDQIIISLSSLSSSVLLRFLNLFGFLFFLFPLSFVIETRVDT